MSRSGYPSHDQSDNRVCTNVTGITYYLAVDLGEATARQVVENGWNTLHPWSVHISKWITLALKELYSRLTLGGKGRKTAGFDGTPAFGGGPTSLFFFFSLTGILPRTPAPPPKLKAEDADTLVANVETLRSEALLNRVKVLAAEEVVEVEYIDGG